MLSFRGAGANRDVGFGLGANIDFFFVLACAAIPLSGLLCNSIATKVYMMRSPPLMNHHQADALHFTLFQACYICIYIHIYIYIYICMYKWTVSFSIAIMSSDPGQNPCHSQVLVQVKSNRTADDPNCKTNLKIYKCSKEATNQPKAGNGT